MVVMGAGTGLGEELQDLKLELRTTLISYGSWSLGRHPAPDEVTGWNCCDLPARLPHQAADPRVGSLHPQGSH